MKEFIDKLISRLEEREVQAYAKTDGGATYTAYRNAIGIVDQLAEEYNNESVKGDLISRSLLLKAIDECLEDCENHMTEPSVWNVIGIIKRQPTVCNDDWIPCSERLPKDEELSKRKEVIVQNIHGEVFTAQYTYNCAHTHKDFFGGYCAIPHIVAWQTLPAPYQPKGE